ncbi:MAG: hypothetical protein ACXAE3_11215 [Candidatus Kariarchaeaceae archaeon]
MEEDQDGLGALSLRVQLAATAVASSFALVFVPNVETISLMAFLFGFLFSLRFAVVSTSMMVVTWEVVLSLVLGFSGITFPFKLIGWIIVTLLGRLARSLRIRYFYEFAIFGAISALIWDLIVTVSLPLFFLGSEEAFIPLLLTSLIFGIVFTISHTVANSILFSMIPVIMRTVLPLIEDAYSWLLELPAAYFNYLEEFKGNEGNFDRQAIIRFSQKRFVSYIVVSLLIVILLSTGVYLFVNDRPVNDGAIAVELHIVYNGAAPDETFDLDIPGNWTLLQLLESVSTVDYTLQYGPPYVIGINGYMESLPDDYWIFRIDGVGINMDVNSTYLEEGNLIEAVYF